MLYRRRARKNASSCIVTIQCSDSRFGVLLFTGARTCRAQSMPVVSQALESIAVFVEKTPPRPCSELGRVTPHNLLRFARASKRFQ